MKTYGIIAVRKNWRADMFQGFSQEALDLLLGVRLNNSREWFEPRKQVYIDKIYEPMKALGEELFKPFEDANGMMYKVGRIYRDEKFPPYLHYRDTLWIYVRYEAFWWNKTPTLYFELSPEGAEFGFRISKPDAAVMERFRAQLSENCKPFIEMIEKLENEHGVTIGGDEYKRKKPCSVPEAERFFLKKGLSAYLRVSEPGVLFSAELSGRVSRLFDALVPLNDYFHELVELEDIARSLEKENSAQVPEPEINMVKAPDIDFMW